MTIRPGARLISILAYLCVGALLLPLLPAAKWALLFFLLITLGVSLWECVLLKRVSFGAERSAIMALSLDEEQELPLALKTDSTRTLQMTVRQVWPNLLLQRSSTLEGQCHPGEFLRLSYKPRSIARGAAVLEPPHVAATIWGLVERIEAVGAPGEIKVIPNLQAVRRLHRQLNQFALRGAGTRIAPHLGKGREFDRLREYTLDDDFRDIAWKQSAHHGKLIVREFRLDRSQDILICLDRGHRMAARVGRITKLDHAVNAAVLISYICNRMEDRVGLLSFGAEIEQGIAQGRGAAHLRQVTAFATGIKPEYIHTDYLALSMHLRRRLRHRTLILIMTDLPEGDARYALAKAVKMLAPQHLPLIVILTDPDLKAASQFLPSDKAELCRTLVAKDVWTERQQTVKELRRLGALVVDTVPEDTGVDSINAYLDVKRRQLL